MSGWALIDEITVNLGKGWAVEAGALQCAGHFAGMASGPDGMRLFFITRTEMLDPRMEHGCPPLGYLRVDGRFPFLDEELDAKISLTLSDSLSASVIARQIRARLLPPYADFLSSLKLHVIPGLPESEAASTFVRTMMEESARTWPDLYETLRTLRKFTVKDETLASLHCSLAAIALGLQAVKNLYPPEQAHRIERLVSDAMNDQWAVEEVRLHAAAFQQESLDGLDPLGAVVGRMLHRCLGENIGKFEAEVGGVKTGFVDALAMKAGMTAIAGVVAKWNWKSIRENLRLVRT